MHGQFFVLGGIGSWFLSPALLVVTALPFGRPTKDLGRCCHPAPERGCELSCKDRGGFTGLTLSRLLFKMKIQNLRSSTRYTK